MRTIYRDNPVVKMREALGMTRNDLCGFGIPYNTVVNIERGMINAMKPKTAERLAEVLGVGVADLIATYQAYRETCKNKKPVRVEASRQALGTGVNQ